ncbi:uncharacterized protein DC041_0009161 [Schistosoma bovis]|uniref:Uncharacterized protein n=1 Tax=Schistosoma bovis TaxID=6184 RepID=A0A430QA91_SCHBO|nr:uncharacterized protein DC041_0009161 [Schistosoma bovis]
MSDLESFDEDSLIENKIDHETRYGEKTQNKNVNCLMNNDIVNNNHDINGENIIYYNHVENEAVDVPIKECKSSDLNPSVIHNYEKFEESLTSESVPPLNLLSEESSIIEATESCKKAFNIDLRAESMTSNSSENSLEESRGEIIPTQWNQCSQKLKKLQLDKINPNRSTKSTMCGSNNNYQYGEPIILGEAKCLTNNQFLLSPNLKITKRHREYFQSDPVLCSNRQLINNKENYINESQWNGNNLSQLTSSPSILSSPTSYKQITPKINQPLFPAWSAYSNKLYTLRNTKNSLVRENNAVNQPIESYWEIQPTYSSYEQLNGYSLSGNTQIESSRKEISYNSYPTSASGVFRMGILQQAELAKAHKQFCHKYYSSPPMELETKTRLHTLCSPNVNTQKTAQPCFNNSNSNSLTSGNSSQRKPLMLSQQRYTLKDYSLLPSINSKSRGLGPDIDNEEYRQKTSASGVFRMGILQQAELAKAHKQFCHKYYSSPPMELETKTRLHTLCSPNVNTQKTAQPCFNNSNSNSLTSGNSSQRKPLMLSQQRYTLKDYSLLPSINSKSRGLGPDIDNEEYRQKCKEKSNARVLHSENNIIGCTDSHNDTSNSSPGDKNYSNKENEEKFEPDANKCSNPNLTQATQNKSENLSDDKSKDKHNTLLCSPHQISLSSHQTFKNGTNLESKTGTARNPPEISKEEMNKQKAAEKRLAENDRNLKKSNDYKLWSKSDAELLEMLRRHDEDRKRFEEIQKTLRVKI